LRLLYSKIDFAVAEALEGVLELLQGHLLGNVADEQTHLILKL
jgi:hypothetical protein